VFACIYCRKVVPDVSLTDFAYAFSPLLEKTGTGTLVLDVEGCELLFGSAYELANDIAKLAAKPKSAGGLGTLVNVAVAANPDTAVYAARFLKGITFISPGEELTCLGPLPIEGLLTLTSEFLTTSPNEKMGRARSEEKKRREQVQEILDTLRLWGVQTFRDFAALPSKGVSERLGQAGIKLQQLAAGKTNRHLQLIQTPPDFQISIELEHPIAELEPLAFILARLLNQVCARLNEYALATNELRIKLKLEDGVLYERKLTLPSPMRDHKVFLKLLLLNTENNPPQSPVLAVSVACEPVNPSVLQNGLFIPRAPEPEKLELTLARLSRLVGADNIGSPELRDTYRPDAFRMKRFVLKEPARRGAGKNKVTPRSAPTGGQRCVSGFRVFRPPLRAAVETHQGYPIKITAPDKTRNVKGRVVQLAGPWRTSGEWWRTDGWARDEWDLAVQSNAGAGNGEPLQILYRVYRELKSGAWFVAGMYD
jgi:protein ImuB